MYFGWGLRTSPMQKVRRSVPSFEYDGVPVNKCSSRLLDHPTLESEVSVTSSIPALTGELTYCNHPL